MRRRRGALPGDARVRALGSACPAGDLPADLPADVPRVAVVPGATGGDGSDDAPFGTVEEALAAVPSGGIVALGRRVHELAAPTEVPEGVTLWGACAADTVLRRETAMPDVETDALLVVRAAGVTIRNLHLSAPDVVDGVAVLPPGTLAIDDAIVEGGFHGIHLPTAGASAEAHRVVFRDMQGSAVFTFGGSATVRQALVSGAQAGAAARTPSCSRTWRCSTPSAPSR